MWYLIIILIFIFATAFYLEYREHRYYDDYDEEKYDGQDLLPYHKKYYLFSIAEKRFYDILKSFLKDEYLVFGKVRVADLLYYPKRQRDWLSRFNRIKAKHVDFVICDKNKICPLIVIELDDLSHNRYDRKERDNFIDKIFGEAKLPILHIKNPYDYDLPSLQKEIARILSN